MSELKNSFLNLPENPLDNDVQDGGFLPIFRTIGCIGDSLSSGEHEYIKADGSTGYYDMFEYSWGQFMARKCGLKAYNFSCGGLTAAAFHSLAEKEGTFTEEKKCQAYIIALGANDINNIENKELYPFGFGSIDDVDFENYENNRRSFVGEYAKILQKIQRLEPLAKIFLLTIPKRHDESQEINMLCNMHSEFLNILPGYFENTYVADLRKYIIQKYRDGSDMDFKKAFSDFKDLYMLGGHLNSMGYKWLADIIISSIDWIIKSDYSNFRTSAFIGKDVLYDNRPKA